MAASVGNFFIADADNHRIRKVGTNGVITTVAGGGNANPGDGGLATDVALSFPSGIRIDNVGNILIADVNGERVRKVGTNGIITTVAGNGNANFSGDGGMATNALLNYPYDVVLDNLGNLLIADQSNNRIRRVGTNGIITTVVGNGSASYSGDGGVATNAALNYPCGVAMDSSGNVFIADGNNHRIRKVDTNGIITTVAGNGNNSYSGDGGAATNAALYFPYGVAVDSMGNIFIADHNNHRIRKVETDGIITTVAGNGSPNYSGDGGAANNTGIYLPWGVAIDVRGNLLIADGNHCVRKVSAVNQPTLILTNVSNNDLGNYSVIITAPAGIFTSSASLSLPLSPQNFVGFAGVNGFQLQLVGSPGYFYVLQSATNLTPPIDWQPVFTNPADGSGNWFFTVTNLTGLPGQYFRAFRQ